MADIKFLELLSKDYPNVKAATAEIINLSAILALPKVARWITKWS